MTKGEQLETIMRYVIIENRHTDGQYDVDLKEAFDDTLNALGVGTSTDYIFNSTAIACGVRFHRMENYPVILDSSWESYRVRLPQFDDITRRHHTQSYHNVAGGIINRFDTLTITY